MGSKNGAVGDKNRKWNWKGEERAVGDKTGTLLFSNTCVQQGYRGYVRHIRGGIKPLSVSPRKSEVALKSNLPFRTIHSFIFFCLEPRGRSVVSSEVECGGVAKIRKKLYISYHSAIDEHRRKCTYIVDRPHNTPDSPPLRFRESNLPNFPPPLLSPPLLSLPNRICRKVGCIPSSRSPRFFSNSLWLRRRRGSLSVEEGHSPLVFRLLRKYRYPSSTSTDEGWKMNE